jgi:hypothetical protein
MDQVEHKHTSFVEYIDDMRAHHKTCRGEFLPADHNAGFGYVCQSCKGLWWISLRDSFLSMKEDENDSELIKNNKQIYTALAKTTGSRKAILDLIHNTV